MMPTTTETDMDLTDLAVVSKRLNASTDTFNLHLEHIQEQINALNLGVEVFLTSTNESLAKGRPQYDEAMPHQRIVPEHELGYGRLGDNWGLLVREMRYEQTNESGDWEYTGDAEEADRKFLLRSSRATRVKAVGFIPALVEALKNAALEVVEAVEQAKRLAESLES